MRKPNKIGHSNLTAEQRSERARLAALSRWAREKPDANAARGQQGLLAKFEAEVDPDRELSPEERHRRAVAARGAHMSRLALISSKARRAVDPVADSPIVGFRYTDPTTGEVVMLAPENVVIVTRA